MTWHDKCSSILRRQCRHITRTEHSKGLRLWTFAYTPAFPIPTHAHAADCVRRTGYRTCTRRDETSTRKGSSTNSHFRTPIKLTRHVHLCQQKAAPKQISALELRHAVMILPDLGEEKSLSTAAPRPKNLSRERPAAYHTPREGGRPGHHLSNHVSCIVNQCTQPLQPPTQPPISSCAPANASAGAVELPEAPAADRIPVASPCKHNDSSHRL